MIADFGVMLGAYIVYFFVKHLFTFDPKEEPAFARWIIVFVIVITLAFMGHLYRFELLN